MHMVDPADSEVGAWGCMFTYHVQVQQVFDDMYTAGLQPNIMTYITLLSSYAELGKWQNALHILNHMCQPQVS